MKYERVKRLNTNRPLVYSWRNVLFIRIHKRVCRRDRGKTCFIGLVESFSVPTVIFSGEIQ